MSVNIQNFVAKQSKLVTKKSAKRVAKLDLTGKKNRGSVKLHIVPDSNELPMLTTKNVFEVHETETYTYQDEVRTRYPVYTIPNPENYNIVDGAVMPTDMQITKLNNCIELLDRYVSLSKTPWTPKKPLDTSKTDTKLTAKFIGTYTKFWSKISEFNPENKDAKQPDLSNLIMVTHSSSNFIKAFNKWATPDSDSEISVEEQIKKIEDAVSCEPGTNLRCIKIETAKSAGIGYDVEIKNLKIENASIDLTEEDIAGATPLISEDWDYTVFDDEKVDSLIAKLEAYLKPYENVELDSDSEDEENEEEATNENPFAEE